MKDNKKLPDEAAALRARAEKKVESERTKPDKASDFAAVLHELRVHQVELEMQNEELRTAQRELEQSRNRYASLYDFAPTGHLTLDAAGVIREINLTAANWLNQEPARLLGRPFLHFLLSESRSVFLDHLKLLADQRNEFEVVLAVRGGISRPVQLLTTPARDGEHSAPMIWVAMVDIGQRVQADRARRESELRIRTLAGNLPDAVLYQITGDAKGNRRFTYVSDAVLRVCGVGVKAVLADANVLYSQVLPEYLPGLMAAEDRAAREGRAFRHEFQARLPGGKIRWFALSSTPHVLPDGSGVGDGVLTDITERKQAEEALRELNDELEERVTGRTAELASAEAKYRGLAENTLDIPCHIAASGEILYIGPQARRYGFEPEEITGRNFLDVIHPGDRERMSADFSMTLTSGEAIPSEFRIQSPDGRVHWFEERSGIDRDAAGRITGLTGVLRDITQRKTDEQARRESDERYHQLFDTISDAVMVFDFETRQMLEVNAASLRIYGYTREELLALTYSQITTEPERSEEAIRETVEGRVSHIPLRYHRKKNGTVFPVEITAGTIRMDGRTLVCGILHDISDRKRTYTALAESESRYRHLYEQSPIGIYRTTPDGRIVLANPAIVQMLGYDSFEELSARNLEAAGFPPDSPRSRFKELMDRDGKVRGFETVWLAKDGGRIIVEENARTIRGPDGAILHYEGTVENITARKQAEEALAASEMRFQRMAANIEDVLYAVDGKTGEFQYVSPAFERLFGYTLDDVTRAGGREKFLSAIIHEGKFAEQQSVFRSMQAGGTTESRQWESWWRCKDGTLRCIEDRWIPGFAGQGLAFTYGVLRDITERKQAERAAQASRQILQTVVNHMPAAVSLLRGSDLRIQLVNPAYQAIAPGKEMTGKTFNELWPETGQDFAAICRRVLETGEPNQVLDEMNMIRRSPGGPLEKAYFSWSLFRVQLPGDEGWGLLNTSWETTARKRAEETLMLSEKQFRAMFETASIGMAQADLQTGRWLRVNRKMCEITGYSADEMLKLRISDVTHPEDRQRDWELFQRVIRGDQPDYHLEKRYIRKDGSLAWVNVNMTVVYDANGQPLRTIAAIEDITERKRAESQLRLEDAALAAAANGIAIVDRDGNIIWVNAAFSSMTGYSLNEARGQNPRVLKSGYQDDAFYKNMWRTILAGEVWHGELVNKKKDASHYNEEMMITPVKSAAGKVTHFIAIKQDITRRKRMEHEMMTAIERAQERIGQDLHDGLCQILTGAKFKTALLGQKLQGWSPLSEAGDAAAIETLLDEAIEQARGLAYGLNPVKADTGGLMEALQQLAASVDSETGPRCVCHISKPVQIADRSVALNLYRIAQEAVQNSLKHSGAKNICIELTRRAGANTMTVSDDGAGMKAADASGTGLINMHARAELIGGKLEIKTSGGRGVSVICRLPRAGKTSGSSP